MKKLFSLFCVALASATLLAIPTVSKRQTVENPKAMSMTVKQAPAEVVNANQTVAFRVDDAKKVIAEVQTDTLLANYYTANQFVTGTPAGGMQYVDFAQIVVPFSDSVYFMNGYKVPMTPEWEVGEETTSGPTFAIEAGEFGGEFDLPTLKYNPALLPTSDTTAVYFKPYQFGQLFTSYYAEYGFVNNVIMAPDYLQSITQCGYFTECAYDEGDETYGSGTAIFGGGDLGYYRYGYNLKNPFNPDTIVTPAAGGGNDTTLEYHYFDTIMQIVNNTETMYISQISVLVTDFENHKLFKDSSTVLTMTILPLTSDGIDWDNPIAVGQGGLKTLVPYKSGSTVRNYMGLLMFYFYEEDEAGMVQRVPVVVDGSFVVAISGLTQDGVTLGFYSDNPYLEDAPASQTYYPYFKNGKRTYTQLWKTPSNMVVNLYALWPSIQGLPEEVNVPLSGETLNVTLPTNVWAEDMDIIGEDWINIDVVSQVENPDTENEEFLYAVDATITIEEADAPRQGEIVIEALGKIYTITVNQTGGATSIESVKKVNDGKLYNVLGIEVDENYKGVVIRNGEKFLQ